MLKALLKSSMRASNDPRLKCLVHPKEGEPFEAYLEKPKKVADRNPRIPKYQWELPSGTTLFYRTHRAARVFNEKISGTTFQARMCLSGSDEEMSVCVELL